MTNEVNWSDAIWQEINDAVAQEVHKVRIAQKVFPTILLDSDPTEIQNEVIDFTDFTVEEGTTKPFVEIYLEFTLTSAQVSKEAQLKTCKTLARMAAKQIALVEDAIIFQGVDAKNVLSDSNNPASEKILPGKVKADHIDKTDHGLLGEALKVDKDQKVIGEVVKVYKPNNAKNGVEYGENIFAKVAEAIAKLTDKAQAPTFALFLPTKIYADTFVPPSDQSLVTTAERIKPLVEGGFYGTGTLPEKIGLLVAEGGDPTTIYIGREAKAEYLRKEGSKYIFRVVERIQFVARDPRAYVRLEFQDVADPAGAVLPDPRFEVINAIKELTNAVKANGGMPLKKGNNGKGEKAVEKKEDNL